MAPGPKPSGQDALRGSAPPGPSLCGNGLLNILEGLHSFVSQLQRLGVPSSPCPPHVLPTQAYRALCLRAQRRRVGQDAGSRGREGPLSLPLSSGLRKRSGTTRSEGHVCPGLLFPNPNTPLQRTLFFRLTVFLRPHKATTVTFWPKRPAESCRQGSRSSLSCKYTETGTQRDTRPSLPSETDSLVGREVRC